MRLTMFLLLLVAGALARADGAAQFRDCTDRCEAERNQCLEGRTETFRHCMDAQIVCLDRCDPQTRSDLVQRAKHESRLYRDRPDLLRMRRTLETSDPGRACIERCDRSAGLCAESGVRQESCYIARHNCRARCGKGQMPPDDEP